MDINLEGLPAAIERKCGEVLATANRIDEINACSNTCWQFFYHGGRQRQDRRIGL